MKKLRSIVTRFSADDLLRHAGILFSGMMVVHVCNMVFQMAVSRALPKEEYALLAAFLGALAIIQRPLATLATGITHYSSLMRLEGRSGDVKRLLRKWLLLAGGVGVFLGALAVVFNVTLSRFFHLNRVAPVIIAGAVLPVLFCQSVLMGVSRGFQLFKMGLTAGVVGALTRLGLGAGFVWFVVPACGWAMLGHGAGIYITAAILLAGLIFILRGQPKSEAPLPSMRLYLAQSFFIQAACAVLATADVIMVKHYIPEDMDFAYAATLGRIIVFLPGAIVAAMFPKVVSRGIGTREQHKTFLKSLGLTAIFVAVAVTGCALLPGLLAQIFFGIADASDYLRGMIGAMALVMGAFAVLNVTVQFLLAQQRFLPGFITIGFAVMYLLGVKFFHATSLHVVAIAALCNVGALVFTLGCVVRTAHRRSPIKEV